MGAVYFVAVPLGLPLLQVSGGSRRDNHIREFGASPLCLPRKPCSTSGKCTNTGKLTEAVSPWQKSFRCSVLISSTTGCSSPWIRATFSCPNKLFTSQNMYFDTSVFSLFYLHSPFPLVYFL